MNKWYSEQLNIMEPRSIFWKRTNLKRLRRWWSLQLRFAILRLTFWKDLWIPSLIRSDLSMQFVIVKSSFLNLDAKRHDSFFSHHASSQFILFSCEFESTL